MTTYLCECIGVSKSGYYNYLKNENKRVERYNKVGDNNVKNIIYRCSSKKIK